VKDNSRGILIFAFNNKKVDYFSHACWVADRVNLYLDLPVSIVTDEASINGRNVTHNLITGVAESGGNRNFDHKTSDNVATWYNASRYTAYNLTPYNETIVIDSDYIVNSDQLKTVFELGHDVLCARNAYDVTNLNRFDPYKYFGRYNFPHYWATVLFFRKSDFAKQFFDVLTMVRKNYKHYSQIYKFSHYMFRNDYAVSIALSMVYGHNLDAIPSIPWSLPTCYDDIDVINVSENTFQLNFTKKINNQDKVFRSTLNDCDLHCINKFALEKMVNG